VVLMKVIFFFKITICHINNRCEKDSKFFVYVYFIFYFVVLVRLPIWNANYYHFSILFGQKKSRKNKKSLTHHHISSTGIVKFP